MKVLAALLLPLALAAGQPAYQEVDLKLPGSKSPLRLQVATEGTSPEARWTEFLDCWFDWFDRDGDKQLTKAEAARIFPLPLADGRTVAFDFEQADSDKNGSIGRAEFHAFYRRSGFAALQTVVLPPSAEDLRLAEAMFRHLSGGDMSRITLENLQRAEALLRKLDENEDEVLTPVEVLSLGFPAKKPLARGDFQWLPAKEKATSGVRLSFRKNGDMSGEAFGSGPVLLQSSGQIARARFAGAVLTISSGPDDPAQSIATMRRFVVSQFKIAAGSRASLDKQQVAGDASLQLVAELFPHANRKGDGKLTLVELEQFLDLIEKGVTCAVVVTLTDRGRNLFHHLDTNGDGSLDGTELLKAGRLLKDLDGGEGWSREQVPHALRITIQQGIAEGSFGPIPLVATRKILSTPTQRGGKRGPAWFQAMDRNGDGFVSRAEFLGTTDQFRQLDLDGDGRISVDEAERAEKMK